MTNKYQKILLINLHFTVIKRKLLFAIVILVTLLGVMNEFGLVARTDNLAISNKLEAINYTHLQTFLNFHNISANDSKSLMNVEYFLNIRKLNVFAVHEMNKIVLSAGEAYRINCIRWWSNPLETHSHTITHRTEKFFDHLISYIADPGRIPFEVKIRQQIPPIDVDDVELEVITPFRALSPLPNQFCIYPDAYDDIKSVCYCKNMSEVSANKLENETLEVRQLWNIFDPELETWRLHKSFSVGDYLNFSNYQTFHYSPGRANVTKQLEYCDPTTKMLIMISSAPNHFLHRKVIRETYGNSSNLQPKGVRLVFLMGKVDDLNILTELKTELRNYDDIIMEDFADSYHNLTLSHLSMYKWAFLTCADHERSPPKFILKADDDFLINVDLALRLIERNPGILYVGCLYCGTPPIRSLNKYYTPHYMLFPDVYPGYLSGVTYIFSTDLIPRVLHSSLTIPIIHMDDAYMTGLIPRQLKVYPRNSPLIGYGRSEETCQLQRSINSYALNSTDMMMQWRKLTQPTPTNCSMEDINLKLDILDDFNKKACHFL